MNCMGSGALVRMLWVLFLGQLVSLLLASGSFTSSLLSNLGVDAPLTQSFFTYCMLAVVYGGILLYRREKLKVSWYWYLGLAFADVQGNFLVIKAYQFSSITSVTLLDCWTIPWVLILTRIYIGTKYSLLHFLGAAVCIVGLVLVILSDASASTLGVSNAILGDLLVVAGTLFYAISNVGEEFCTKKKDLVEVVGMLGVFGVLVNGCEMYLRPVVGLISFMCFLQTFMCISVRVC